MQLKELQRAFQARVLSLQTGIERELNGSTTDDFEERLGTYVGGYRSRLLEALGATYPVLHRTLGDDDFARQITDFIDCTPSRHFSIRQYGGQVHERLIASNHLGKGRQLAELARWEWTLADVFDAPDDRPLQMSALARVAPHDWPAITFALRASVRRFDSTTNVIEWWRAANALCPQPAAVEDAASVQWLLWRRGIKTLFRSLDPLEADVLEAAGAGGNFGELCELVAQRVDASEAAQRAASLLRGWVADELLCDRAATISE